MEPNNSIGVKLVSVTDFLLLFVIWKKTNKQTNKQNKKQNKNINDCENMFGTRQSGAKTSFLLIPFAVYSFQGQANTFNINP